MDGGGELSRLRDDPRVRSAWAEYLVRYVLAYAGEGLPIARLSPQNEMDCNPTYPGCVMSPEQTIPLLVEHLAPRLRAAMPAVELWAGTFREGDKAPWAAACLRDPAFRKAIDGIAVQYFEHRHVAALTAAWPELRLMHSEADCRDGSNSAAQARLRLGEITGIINAGCDSFAYWNMLLDERQKSGWNWSQNSLATIDRGSGTVRYNPDWQPVALASRSIRAGDVRIAATALGDAGPVSGFARKDGSVTLLCGNRMSAARVLAVRVGARSMTLRLPPDSDCAITLAP